MTEASGRAGRPVLRVEGVWVGFGAAPGLAGVSFSINSGETLGVVGPSGAGKTTLLRALAGLIPVQGGGVEVAGVSVTGLPPERRRIVYLHQQPVLFPHMSVGRNIDFPMRLRRVAADERARRVAELLEAVELGGFEARSPASLSGGQRHRVALARAMAADPAVLLLDEPFAALDGGLREGVRRALDTLQSRFGFAVLLVTHDLEEAGGAGNRIGVLLEGGVRQVGTLRQLARAPGSPEVARFMGLRNELPGELRADGRFLCALGEIDVRAGAGGVGVVGDAGGVGVVGGRTGAAADALGAGTVAGPAVAFFGPGAASVTRDSAGPGVVDAVRVHAEGHTVRVRVGDCLIEVRVPDEAGGAGDARGPDEGKGAGDARGLAAGDRVGVRVDPRRMVLFGAGWRNETLREP